MATGGTVAQDLTMQWSSMSGFMQDLSLMVIDEGQQYGTDREIATLSLLNQQPQQQNLPYAIKPGCSNDPIAGRLRQWRTHPT